MSVYFGNFDVESYNRELKWVLYVDEGRSDMLDTLNYYLDRNDERFEVRRGIDKEVVSKLQTSVMRYATVGVGSIHHMWWLKVVLNDKLPLMCHMMMRDKKVFMYLLKLSPWSVLESLDGVTSVFNYAVSHKLRWYYEKMLKYMLHEGQNNYLEVLERVFKKSSDVLLNDLMCSSKSRDVRYLLKMLRKVRGEVLSDSMNVICIEMYLKTRIEKLSTLLVKFVEVLEVEVMIRMLDHGIEMGWTESVCELLNQGKRRGMDLDTRGKGKLRYDYVNTSMMKSISCKRSVILSMLLSNGYEKDRGEVETPLMYAIDMSGGTLEDYRLIEVLLEWNCDVNYVCPIGLGMLTYGRNLYTALEMAASKGDKRILSMLFGSGEELHDVDNRAKAMYLKGIERRGLEVELEDKWWMDSMSKKNRERVIECAGMVLLRHEEEAGEGEEGEEEGVLGEFMKDVDNSDYVLEMVLGMI